MPKGWYWSLSHTLDSKIYCPYANGQIAAATLKNTGEASLYIYMVLVLDSNGKEKYAAGGVTSVISFLTLEKKLNYHW